MILEPLLDRFAVMDTKIIQDQKDFARRIFDQSFQKGDHHLRVHISFIDHKAHCALIGDRTDQIDAGSFSAQANNRRLYPGGKTAPPMLAIRSQPGFISPIDLSILIFSFPGNTWILFVKPFLHSRRVLFIRSTKWLLGGKTPSAKIFSDGPNRHSNLEKLQNQRLYCPSCPQRKGKLELIWRLIGYRLLQPHFQFMSQCPAASKFSAALVTLNSFGPVCFVRFVPIAGIGRVDADDFAYFFIRLACLTKSDNLVAQLLLRLWTQFACINLFHVKRYNITHFYLVVIFAGLIFRFSIHLLIFILALTPAASVTL